MSVGYDFSLLDSLTGQLPYKTATICQKTAPIKELACSSMPDDFYSNLIDWSAEHIYYSVDNAVYSYNFYSESVQKIHEDYNITSIKHSRQSSVLCLGTSSGLLVLVDTNTGKSSRHMYHKSRIGAIELFGSGIVTGSRDKRRR